MQITVRVPATSANLGCGFDVFGLALGLYTEFVFEPASDRTLQVEGEGAAALQAEGCSLVLEAAAAYAKAKTTILPNFKLTVRNNIPLGRGLGSSAAAIVGGLVGASALLNEERWFKERKLLLQLATQLEGHPDNVAPALYGGLLIAVMAEATTSPIILPLTVPANLEAVVSIPNFEMSTKAARAVLPKSLPYGDAVHNMARTALFAAIFAQPKPPLSLLREAMADRLHQPYRTAIFPQLPKLIETAQQAGAYGAALSGAGSSVLALVDKAQAETVKQALTEAALAMQLPAKIVQLPIATNGTQTVIA